jgi:excisionase family DNA binding protein
MSDKGAGAVVMLDTQQLAEIIGMHVRSVQRGAAAGELPGVRLGHPWRFPLPEINAYLVSRGYAAITPEDVIAVDQRIRRRRERASRKPKTSAAA